VVPRSFVAERGRHNSPILGPGCARLVGTVGAYQRRHFHWGIAEIVQLALGLSIPALLCTHLIGERMGVTLYGLRRSYAQALYSFWVARPDLGIMQAALLLVAWIHGCIGIYFWLRLQRLFPKMAPVLLGLAVLLPVLALLGFYQQGRTIELLAQQPGWRAQILAPARIGTAPERDNLIRLRDFTLPPLPWFLQRAVLASLTSDAAA
jgi:adenylate cyclase